MEELRNTLSERIESNILKIRGKVDDGDVILDIVNQLIKDPESWNFAEAYEDERFTSIETPDQEHKRRYTYIHMGEISEEEARKQLSSLEEEKEKLTKHENYPIWEAYYLVHSVRADLMTSKEFGF